MMNFIGWCLGLHWRGNVFQDETIQRLMARSLEEVGSKGTNRDLDQKGSLCV